LLTTTPKSEGCAKQTLEELGYCVGKQPNGKEALAAVEETAFDLTVPCLFMPGMNGI
jgi:CheY-like chemotaxis protein